LKIYSINVILNGDWFRLGRIRVRTDPATEEPIRSLGYDPILDDIDNDAFNTMVLKRKVPIKALLLDQTVFAGVGNWIADEVQQFTIISFYSNIYYFSTIRYCTSPQSIQQNCQIL